MREGQNLRKARALRRELTDAERKLWRLLRDRRFGGVKFRRQAPIGPFIADFACPASSWVSNWTATSTLKAHPIAAETLS
jgi:very-short-patch-repair endonuclease